MPQDNPRNKLASLSKRKKEVLGLLCQKKPYKDIAKELFIAESTVKAHMAGIYEKLGLDNLPRDERIFQIKSVYCPLLHGKEESKIIDAEYEEIVEESEEETISEDISPELNAMILYDEKAITTLEGGSDSMQSNQKPIKIKRKKSFIGRVFGFLVVLIAVSLMVAGGFYIWQTFFCPEVPQAEAPQIEPEVVSPAVQAPEAAPQVEIQEPASEIIVEAPAPTVEVVEPTLEVVIVPTVKTEKPTPEVIVQKEYYDVGEWIKKDNVWMRVYLHQVDVSGNLDFRAEIWNKSDKDLMFSWNPSICFTMIDNIGNTYELWDFYGYGDLDKEVIESQDLRKIRYGTYSSIAIFKGDPVFNSEVTDLYLTMQDFSVFEKVKVKVPLR